MLKLQILNCIWLLVPIFVWNAIFATRLPQEGFQSDIGVPQVIKIAEHALRIGVFIWPLFLPLRRDNVLSQTGIILYIIGLLVYLASWLPLLYNPESMWSKSAVSLLAPAFTPLLWFSGIAIIGQSWYYGLVSILFVGVHVYHNVLAFNLFDKG